MDLNKYISYFILFCFWIQVGHDFIPHSHVFNLQDKTEILNHDLDHKHDHNPDQKDSTKNEHEDLINIFSFVQHSGEDILKLSEIYPNFMKVKFSFFLPSIFSQSFILKLQYLLKFQKIVLLDHILLFHFLPI